jgi:hypothetical protein
MPSAGDAFVAKIDTAREAPGLKGDFPGRERVSSQAPKDEKVVLHDIG